MECKPVGETKQCKLCKKILPIDNFKLVYKKSANYNYRRGKCDPCEIEHKHRKKGTWESYQKEKAYIEELHFLQKEGNRRCRYCEKILPLEKFAPTKKGHHGRKSYCSPCAMEKWQKTYRQLPEVRAKKREHDRKYRSKSSSKKRVNEQRYEKYHNDPAYKLKVLMRGRLNKVLDRKKTTKRFTQELGCTFDELVVHLESQFYPDPRTGEIMSWDNHSMEGWHVDHVKPLHEFDLYNDDEFKEAAHYTNLQPLWWWQNLEKNRGITYKK